MKSKLQRSLAFTTLMALEEKLDELDQLEEFKADERAEIERILRCLIEDEPVTRMLDAELKALRDELPRHDFGDRVPDVAAARAALIILKQALGMPVSNHNNEPEGNEYDGRNEND